MQPFQWFRKTVAVSVLLTALPVLASEVIGNPADSNNCFPFGCGYNGQYQQVYDAAAFSGPIKIAALEFFDTGYNSNAKSMNSGNWTISLSTTKTASSDSISGNFASNLGKDNTVVFSGNLYQPWTFGNTLHIALQSPFSYDPKLGNLLMDVKTSNVSNSGGNIYFNASYNSSLGRVFYGNPQSDYGLVTGFNTAPVPEPETYAMMMAGLGIVGAVARRRKQKQAA